MCLIFQKDTGDQRLTPLMDAARSGCRESVETLLDLGADPNILNADGTPALFHALQAGDQVITERLAAITTKGEAHRGQLIRLVTAFRIITMYVDVS